MRCQALAASPRFQRAVIATIVFNAALMGIETSAVAMEAAGPLLLGLNKLVQAVFLFEIAVRLTAFWPRLGAFFLDGWNVFDFLIVALSLLPVGGPLANVARLARILRVARLLSVSGELRLIIGTMLRSIPSLGHVAVLLGILMYVYGLFGFYMFKQTDPMHWGSLVLALRSVFQLLTLEGWVEMQVAVIDRHPFSPIFFGSFIVVAVFVVINLFIAVVINNLEKARDEQRAEEEDRLPEAALLATVRDLRARLDELESRLTR
jgi:voltage-gated sodium channel